MKFFPQGRNLKINVLQDANGSKHYDVVIQWRFFGLFHIPIWTIVGSFDNYSECASFDYEAEATEFMAGYIHNLKKWDRKKVGEIKL